jgi:5'-nucleotidase
MVNNQIHIPKQEELTKKLAEFKRDGFSGFHVVADFDRTLTKGHIDGKHFSTSELVKNELHFSSEYQIEYKKLHDEYYSQEISPFIPLDQKKKLMNEWWNKFLQLTVDSGLKLEMLENIIK